MSNKIVTDGNRVFENYYWNEEKQIISKLTGKELKGDKSQNYCNYCLYQKDGKFRRERTVLLKASFPQMFQPEHKELYMDVFGMEDKYCFLKSNPNIVWSKNQRKFLKLKKTKNGHLCFVPKNKGDKWAKPKYIHVMVWESYNQKKYNGKRFNTHHVNMNKEDNRIENLLLIPTNIHHSFHTNYQFYIGKQRNSRGRKYIKTISYEEFVRIINSYKLNKFQKQVLLNSIV